MNALEIRNHNIEAHLDIEQDIQTKKNGQVTFTVRVNAGNIVDYNVTEYVDARRKYGQVATVIVTQLTTTHHLGE